MCVADIERYFHSYLCIQYWGVHGVSLLYKYIRGRVSSMVHPHLWYSQLIYSGWLVHCHTSLVPDAKICNVFEICGFTMNASKFKYDQQVVFLGILIDSVTMTVRIDPIAAKSFRIELQVHLNVLLANKHFDFHCIRPICGKLNWFAELLQSGRLHITSCWNSKRWDGSLGYPDKSMWFELRSLADFLEETTINDCMLVRLNDNDASTHGANKGNCKDPVSHLLRPATSTDHRNLGSPRI